MVGCYFCPGMLCEPCQFSWFGLAGLVTQLKPACYITRATPMHNRPYKYNIMLLNTYKIIHNITRYKTLAEYLLIGYCLDVCATPDATPTSSVNVKPRTATSSMEEGLMAHHKTSHQTKTNPFTKRVRFFQHVYY